MIRLAFSVALLGLAQAYNPTILHQFSSPTWLENIAIYPAESAVLTTELYPSSTLWMVPFDSRSEPVAVHTFEPELSLIGITVSPISPSDYYVIVGNYSFTTGSEAGSYGVYCVDLKKGAANARVSEVVLMTNASLLNGIAPFPKTKTLLLTDSEYGYIWQLNPSSGSYSIFLDVPELKPSGDVLGANGLKIHESGSETYVYWSSSGQKLLCRIRLDSRTNRPTGDVETLYNGTFFDDFSVGRLGDVYLATGTSNVVKKLEQVRSGQWKLSTIAGDIDDNILAGSTSVALDQSSNTLYVSTNGGYQAPVNGTLIGGHIVKIKL